MAISNVEHGAKVPSAESSTLLYPMDGACQSVPPDGTAYAYRDAMLSTVIGGVLKDPADNEPTMHWVREYYEALRPYSEEGGYVNFMAGENQGRVRANYGQNYRLVEIN